MFASSCSFRYIVSLSLLYFLVLHCSNRASASVSEIITKLNSEKDPSIAISASSCIVKYLRNYFDGIQLPGKTIHLVLSNNADAIDSVEEHFLMELHKSEPHWLSVQVFTLAESYDFDQSGWISPINRQDFVYFNNINDAELAMDQLIHDGPFGSAHLHLICIENCSEEQITSFFATATNSRFGRNMNVFVQRDVGKWAWYSANARNGNCDWTIASIEAEFQWDCSMCVRINDNERERLSGELNTRCPLKVASIHSPPYMYYDEKRGFYKGIEYFMLEAVAEKLNVQITLRHVNVTEYFDIYNAINDFNELNIG